MRNRQYLEEHGSQWRVTVAVPKDLRQALEQTRVKLGLGTDSLAHANRVKGSVVLAIKDEFGRCERELRAGRSPKLNLGAAKRMCERSPVPDMAAAVRYLEQRAALDPDSEAYDITALEIIADAEIIAGEPVGTDADGLLRYDPAREAKAIEFSKTAFGKLTPLRLAEPAYRSRRVVPIHSSLAELVARRTAGRHAQEWLFPEVPELDPKGSPENRRSNRAGKAFIVYRKSVGVDDRPEDKERSRVNFHSFRRWFITRASEALELGAQGYSDTTVAEVVGHKPQGMTQGTYRGASPVDFKRACVEAVQLPV